MAVTRNFLLGGGAKQYWGAQQRRRQDFGSGDIQLKNYSAKDFENLYKIRTKFKIFSKYFKKYFNLKTILRKYLENYR